MLVELFGQFCSVSMCTVQNPKLACYDFPVVFKEIECVFMPDPKLACYDFPVVFKEIECVFMPDWLIVTLSHRDLVNSCFFYKR